MARRVIVLLVGIGLFLVAGGPALAHASDRGFVMLLPTDYYLVGGALAVAVSFVLLAFVPASWLARFDRPGPVLFRAAEGARPWVSGAVFVFLTYLLHMGMAGAPDPLSNPLPLTVWTLWWVGLTLLHAVFGNLWAWLNPWTGLHRFMGWALGRPGGRLGPWLAYPRWLGYGPAILFFLGFAWFELIDPAPDDPRRMTLAVGGYWVATWIGIAVFGEEAWMSRGECFAVFFRFISRLAHLGGNPVRVQWPGAGLLGEAPLPLGGVLFLLLTLGSVSFDGLNKTFLWLDLIGQNPLEFQGRSAVMTENSLGLLAVWGLMSLAFIGAVGLGWVMAGRSGSLADSLGRLVLSIMPISLAFHLAHYLTVLLVNGQYVALMANDPWYRGWDLLGLADYRVTTSFLSDYRAVTMIWNLQAATIVIGHVLAVLVAHRLALAIHGDNRKASISQVPLAVLMVAYTLFGLWLLSTPTGA